MGGGQSKGSKEALSKEEFMEACELRSQELKERWFNAYDKSGNGSISWSEYNAVANLEKHGSVGDKLAWLFDIYDANKDGRMDRGEFKQTFSLIYSETRPDIPSDAVQAVTEEMFNRLDHNHDGFLYREDFVKRAQQDERILQLLQTDSLMHTGS